MSVSEAELRSQLREQLENDFPSAVVHRHEDRYEAGIPDMSFTLGETVWFEAKLVAPAIRSRDIQRLKILRLANVGRCFYVMYWEHRGERRTYILHPREVIGAKTASAPVFAKTLTSASVVGFDHGYVSSFIRQSWASKIPSETSTSRSTLHHPSR